MEDARRYPWGSFRVPHTMGAHLIPDPSDRHEGRTMTSHTAVSLLAEAGEHGGEHASLNPALTGGGALFALLLLLWITTRFNRDR